jgi:hypothetical protein
MTREQAVQRAMAASDFKVCRAVILAPADVAAVGRQEAARRGLDCTPYTQAVIQAEQAQNARSDAAMNNYINQLNRPGPALTPPQSMNCRSRQVGNQIFTDCN